MKIVVGADHGGFLRKEAIKKYLESLNYEVIDVGTDSEESVDYPEYAHMAAEKIVSGEADRGILVCGSGLGIGMAANKVSGIRCAMVSEPYSASLARRHNDANMISIGGRTIGEDMSKEIVKVFLTTEFEGGRHERRVNKIEPNRK